MLRFAANLTFLFADLPMLDRIDAAAEAGFKAVEILYPYDEDAKAIRDRLALHGLALTLINAPPPNYAGGTQGFAAIPGGQARFRHDFHRALRYARMLGAGRMHIMAGEAQGPEAEAAFVENLTWAATEAQGFRLTIEPINPVDWPGYFLNDFDQAAAILDRVAAENVTLQFDVYHAQMITGDVAGTWARHRHRVTHVQFADAPGRHEPGTGKIDFRAFFETLSREGYAGHLSAEYRPRKTTQAGLAWLRRWQG